MRVKTFYLRSGRLSESRGVTVFRPDGLPSLDHTNVVYCADGASVERLAPFVAAAIKSNRISPVVLVGVHNSQMHRAEEYLLGVRPELFEAHEQFFTIEVPQWLRNDFGLSTTRECSGVFGYSNGGAFAMAMGRRHREQFGVVISFSAPRTAQPVPKSEYLLRPVPRHYLAAGTYDFSPLIGDNTHRPADRWQRSRARRSTRPVDDLAAWAALWFGLGSAPNHL
jgi:enterochelin esterase-like enzyme